MKNSPFFSRWAQVRKDLMQVLGKFSNQDLDFAPFKGSWTVGEILCHIGDAEEGWFRYVIQHRYEKWPDEFTLSNYPTLERITAMLVDVHAKTEDFLGTLTEEDLRKVIAAPWGNKFPLGWIVWHVMEHEIHHRGELSLILGMLGRDGLDV